MMKRIGFLLPLTLVAAACSTDDAGKTNDIGTTGATGTTGTTEPGPDVDPIPASLEVSVDSYVGDVGQTFTVTVTVFDADGVEIPDEGTDVTVADPETAEVLGPQVTFLTEGIFVVTATLDDGTLATDSEPIRIDDNGPQITITHPNGGEWMEMEDIEVTGLVVDALAGVDTVTVQGEEVALEADGTFEVTVPLEPGANAIEVVATDIDGNVSDAWRGLMAGDSLDPAESMAGMQVAIGGSGIEAIAAPLMAQIDAEVVEAAVKATNPIARGSVSCVDYEADVRSVEYGTPVLTVTPDDGGIDLVIELTDLEAVVRVEADGCGIITLNDNITVTDTLTTISVRATAGYFPAFGGVLVGLPETSVTYTDLDVDYGTIDTILGRVGLSGSDLGIDVGAYLEDAILEVVEAELPPPIVAALEAMEFSETLDVLGSVVELSTAINSISATVDGILVLLDTTAAGPAPDPELPPLPGSLALAGEPPVGDNAVNLALSLAVNELNRILHIAHASGAFRIEISDEELGLDPAVIDFVFPGATTLNLSFEPTLPPVLTPSTSDATLDLSMLSLAMNARGLVDGVDTELVTGFVHVLGTVDAGINAEGDIALEVTGITPIVDVNPPDDASRVAAAESLEDTLATVSAGIIGDLFPAITFAIPEVEGMTLQGTGASTAGDAETWVKIDADIVE